MRLCYYCMSQIKNTKSNYCVNCGKPLEFKLVAERFLKPGSTLQGKFVVGYPIGNGGFGNTYIGWDRVLMRRVAIKEFYPEQYSVRMSDGVTVSVKSESQIERYKNGLRQFLQEARGVAALHDIRGVVEISGFFEENGTGYSVMEYLEGMDVKEILEKAGGKKDYEWCRRVILTVLHTLREIHKRGMIHRDLSPDNIFVTKEGVIKLIDFGAAKHSSAFNDMRSEIICKQGYSPIEQYSKDAAQGPYTDLYALAALFYRMLTGQKPLPAMVRMSNDTLVMPSQMGVEIPEQAEMAIMVCLNIQPQYRLQSADEFMEALDGLNYVPVYEPEWILPPPEKKKSFESMSLGARIAIVACAISILGVVGLGTIYLTSNEKTAGKSEKLIVADERGRKIQDVEGKYDDDLSTEYVYDSNPERDDEIKAQSVIGTIGEDSDLVFYVCSSERVGFLDIRSDWSMSAINMKANVDGISDEKYQPDENAESYDYGKIISITTSEGKEILAADIELKNDSIKIDDIKTVKYVARNFFYWDRFPDFIGRDIDDIEPQQLYVKDVNGTLTPDAGKTGDIKHSKALVDDSWYSFDYDRGVVFSQDRVGDVVDMSQTIDRPLINVVGKRFSIEGKALDLEKQLSQELDCQIKIQGSEDKSVRGIEVDYSGPDDETSIIYNSGNHVAFKSSNDILITILTDSSQPTTEKKKTSESRKKTEEKKTTEQKKKKDSNKRKDKPRSTTENIREWDQF